MAKQDTAEERPEDGKERIPLDYPIEAHGETVSELRLRKPTMGDFKATDGAAGDVEATIRLTATIASVPPSSIEAMDPRDFAKVQRFLAPFVSPMTATG